MPPPRRIAPARPPVQRRNNGGVRRLLGCLLRKSPFNYRAGVVIAGFQLIPGIASVILSEMVLKYNHGIINLDYPRVGFWAGVACYIPTGVVGIFVKKKHTIIICLYMMLCIYAALVGPCMTIYEGVVAGIGSLVYACKSLLKPLFDIEIFGISLLDESICKPFGVEEAVIFHGVLGFIGLVEFVVSIVGSAFCCNSLCCGVSHNAPMDVIV